MQGTYYETDRLSSLIFVLVMFVAFCAVLYIDNKISKKKGLNRRCMACKNRGGDYPPITCKNYNCIFHD